MPQFPNAARSAWSSTRSPNESESATKIRHPLSVHIQSSPETPALCFAKTAIQNPTKAYTVHILQNQGASIIPPQLRGPSLSRSSFASLTLLAK
jgi:hypothetical protein